MKRLYLSDEFIMLIRQGVTSITVPDYQEEDFSVGDKVVIHDNQTGGDVATGVVTKSTRRTKQPDYNDPESSVDDAEEVTLSNIKMI